jgi:Zn-dependent M16 (insulinase) family peptidase
MEKYERGVHWLSDLMYRVVFSPQRIKIIAQKMVNDVSRMKRKGPIVVKCLSRNMIFERGALHSILFRIKSNEILLYLREQHLQL